MTVRANYRLKPMYIVRATGFVKTTVELRAETILKPTG